MSKSAAIQYQAYTGRIVSKTLGKGKASMFALGIIYQSHILIDSAVPVIYSKITFREVQTWRTMVRESLTARGSPSFS